MSSGRLEAKAVNLDIASRLDETGRLLLEQGANPFRARAYHRAAETLRLLDRSVAEILDAEGLEGLERLPGIGTTLARAIRDTLRLGRMPMLERLRGEMDSVSLLSSVPGIGNRLARRLHEDLGIDSLEDLEAAAHDGRLATIAGFGRKRIAGIIDTLASRLRRVSLSPTAAAEASVEERLGVDREYRDGAAAGTLHRIAPRRSNRGGRPGCRFGTRSGARATTRPCSPIRRGRTRRQRRAIGWSCITTEAGESGRTP